VNDRPLLEACAATGRRLIVSLGMWRGGGFPEIAARGGVDFLYCVSKYPTPLAELKLGAVDFTGYAGFSDHTIGIDAAMAALARGARIIEKHFTLDKAMDGPDHAGSMTPDELTALCRFRDRLAEAL